MLAVLHRDASRVHVRVPHRTVPPTASFSGRSALRALTAMAAVALGASVMAGPVQATYPGSNGRISFGSDRFGDTHNIFTMNPNGSDVRRLTSLTFDEGAALSQSWSPDGSKLVYERRPADFSFRDIGEMNADGSDQHILFSDAGFQDFDPKFSPDASRVIFQRCRSDFEACAIYSVRADGRGLTAITHFDVKHNVIDEHPEYSPDGKKIVFDSFNRGGIQAAVYLMDAHGTSLRRVTPTAIEATYADWSPDGSAIVMNAPCCTPEHIAIWKIHPDGSGLEQLTFPGADEYDFNPVFSPGGDKIAFEPSSGTLATSGIATMNADGSGVTTIQAADAFEPSWGPAG
jgi:Tol biopolymer transport system component